MDKKALAEEISRQAKLSLPDAEKFVDTFFGIIAEYFKRGEPVILSELGSFYPREDKKIQFNPSARFKDAIK